MEQEQADSFETTLREHQTNLEAAKVRATLWEAEVQTAIKEGVSAPIQPEDAVLPESPARPRLSVMSATVEEIVNVMAGQPKGLIQIRDELASWLGDMTRYSSNGSERGFYLEAFGGRSFVADRVKFNGKPKTIPHLTMSVLGTSQPDRVNSAILSGDDDGLASRFLYVWPNRVRLARPREQANDVWAFTALGRLHELTMESDEKGESCPLVRMLSDPAANQFEGWWKANADRMDRESGLLAGHMGKMPGLLLRIALTLELLWWAGSDEDGEPLEVSYKAILAAEALVDDYFIPMARRVFGDAGLPKERRLATSLAKHIVSNRIERINGREIYRNGIVQGIKSAEDFKVAAEQLVDADFIIPDPSRAAPNPGVKRKDYVVNPMVFGEVQL